MFSATYYNISAVKWWSSFYNGGDRSTKSKQINDMLLAEFVCYDMHQIIVFDIQYALNIYQYSGYYLEIKLFLFFLYIHYLPYNCGKQNIRPQVFLTAHCMHTQCTVMPQYPVYIHAYTVHLCLPSAYLCLPTSGHLCLSSAHLCTFMPQYPVHVHVYTLHVYAYPVHVCAQFMPTQCPLMHTHCTSIPTQCNFVHIHVNHVHVYAYLMICWL